MTLLDGQADAYAHDLIRSSRDRLNDASAMLDAAQSILLRPPGLDPDGQNPPPLWDDDGFGSWAGPTG